MQITRQQVLDILHRTGQQQLAQHAGPLLPDPVDTDEHGGLLAQLGICRVDLLAAFGTGDADPQRSPDRYGQRQVTPASGHYPYEDTATEPNTLP